MTQIHTMRNLIAASAFGAVTTVIMFAQAGQASAATSVLSCEGSTRRAVLECCEEQLNKKGLPLWMRQAGAHCSTPKIVSCVSGTTGITHVKKTKCKITMHPFLPLKSGGNGSGGKNNQSGPNNQNNQNNQNGKGKP